MSLADIWAAMTDPTSQDGYDQGAVAGANPQSPLAAAMQSAGLAPYGYGSAVIPPGYGASNNPGQAQAVQAAQAANITAGATPVSQAMAPPAPQQPQNPMSQAMAPQQPQAPQTPMGQAMSPQSPIQQQFQNNATNPNLALGQGLMAAGGGMLSGKNFMDGMGQASSNFGPAYQNTMNMQRELNTPKVTPLADGAFSMVQMPGQQPTTVANGDVQNFIRSKMAAQFAYDTFKQNQVKQGQIQVQAAALDGKQGVAAQQNLQTLAQSQQGIQQAQALNEQLKQDPDRLTALQTFAKMPAKLQALAVMSGNPTMVRAQTDLQTRSNAALDGSKIELTGLNGGSDDALKKASGAVPPPDADPANWDSYIGRVSPLLQERTQFYGDVVNRGLSAGNSTANVLGGNGRPVISNPLAGTGQAPVRVSSAADYANVPPGGQFVDPQGNVRTKPQQGQ